MFAAQIKVEDTWHFVREGPIDDLRVTVLTFEEVEKYLDAWLAYGTGQDIRFVEYSA